MATVQQSIELKVPVHAAYDRLTQFEEYPRFMETVESVQQIDDTHLHWTTTMANRPVEWDAEITEQESDRCIAWHNISGPPNAGKVEVRALGPDTSQVTFTLHSEPQQMPGSMSGFTEEEMAQRLRQDLARLKSFIEARGAETDRGHGAKTQAAGATRQDGQARSAPPVRMRHLGELPQDTTAAEHGGTPASDTLGKPGSPTEQGAAGSNNRMQGTDQSGTRPDTERTPESKTTAASGARPEAGPKGGGTAAVVGASGGTDAAAGAHLSGSKGGPGGASPGQRADAAGVTGVPEGTVQGGAISPAAGADAAGGTELGSAASAGDTRRGTGTTSGSGTALAGGGMSGARDAGIAGSKGKAPKP